MKKWNDKHARISRWSLSVRKEEDLVLRHEALRDGTLHFTAETFIGSGCESKVLTATTIEDAKAEAEAWYKTVLELKIALLEETIRGYQETIKSLDGDTA